MKIRNGFVSNSSSTSFIVINTSDKQQTLVGFVNENPQLIEMYNKQYSWCDDISQFQLLYSAKENDEIWKPREEKECVFGDEDGTIIGRVFDYILRDGGESENFSWYFYEWHR